MLALSRWEVGHEALGLVSVANCLFHFLLEHNWIALAETVNALIWLIVNASLIRKGVDNWLLTGLHDGAGLVAALHGVVGVALHDV